MDRAIYKIVTDGKVFRITKTRFGETDFVCDLNGELEFPTKAAAEKYIHQHLSFDGWQEC